MKNTLNNIAIGATDRWKREIWKKRFPVPALLIPIASAIYKSVTTLTTAMLAGYAVDQITEDLDYDENKKENLQ